MCTIAKTGKVIAVKRLKQDKKYKSRELQIHKEMHHQNIVKIQHAFFSNESQTRNPEDALLNIVMDLIPSNVYRIIKYFKSFEQRVHPLLTKCYMY
jgi:serine/threonine protein kinase